MRYARIQDGIVAAIENFDVPEGAEIGVDLFVGLTFVQCSNSAVSEGWLYSGTAFTAPPAPTVTKSDLLAYAGVVRNAKVTGGFTWRSHPITTDTDSRGNIGNACLGAQVIGSSFSTDWKGSDGVFFTLNEGDMIAMGVAIMAYVSACFATESTVDAAINAGTITTMVEIDSAAWPAASAS